MEGFDFESLENALSNLRRNLNHVRGGLSLLQEDKWRDTHMRERNDRDPILTILAIIGAVAAVAAIAFAVYKYFTPDYLEDYDDDYDDRFDDDFFDDEEEEVKIPTAEKKAD
ncbi:hypothetical protein SAMN06296386_1217 [Lachnospiraceae bacterium]|nr:hypothetical protein SAMN06296386_1217 [Lachnospiraceae bacterium]